MKYLFLCEKPSQVKVLGKLLSNKKSEGRAVVGKYKGHDIVLFPLSGHVMGIPYPNEAIEKFKDKSYAETLKFLPVMPKDFNGGKEAWFYKKVPTNTKIYNAFRAKSKGVDRFVLSTDPDNEGASLGVEVLQSLGLTKNLVAYMDMSNLESEDLIKKGFEDAIAGKKGKLDWKIMAYLGFIRKDLDYGIGVNVTRFLQIVLNSKKSFGTQQTRLLYEITKRYLDFVNHKKKYYYKVAVNTKIGKFYAVFGYEEKETKKGKSKTPVYQTESREEAEALAKSLEGRMLEVADVVKKKQTKKSPKWYDGSDIAVEAGKKLKVSPTKLMSEKNGVLEEMYLKGIMTYPRGDSKGMMPLSQFDLQASIAKALAPLVGADRCDFSLRKKHLWYEDGKIQVNHTPFTIASPDVKEKVDKLNKEEKVVFDLALKRLLSVFYPDATELKTVVLAKTGGKELHLSEISDIDLGWRELYGAKRRQSSLEGVHKGDSIRIDSVEVEEVETKPQPLYTIETLIPMMKRKNIGTQATYEQLVSTVLDKEKGFLKVEKGKLIPTEFTIRFLEIVPDSAIHVLDEYEEHIAEAFQSRKMPIAEALKKKDEIIVRVFNAVKEAVERHAEELKRLDPTVRKAKEEPKSTSLRCPKCGAALIDKGKTYACEKQKIEKRDGKWVNVGECDFNIFKEQKIGSILIGLDEEALKKLLSFEVTEVEAYSTKKRKKYNQKVRFNDESYRLDLVFD